MKLTAKEKEKLGVPNDINFKFIENKEVFYIYKIIYSYKTTRNNRKENCRYIPARNWESAFIAFNDYIDDFNKKYEYRKISNVKILDFYDIGTIER